MDRGLYKFIRVDGVYQFGVLHECNHADLARPGETATSAGAIAVSDGRFTVIDKYSIGLRVAMAPESPAEIEKQIGLVYKEQENKDV